MTRLPTRILLVDDHSVVRRGMQQILEESLADAVFADAGSGEEAVSEVRSREWDVVILDISLPDKNGLDVLKELRQIRPKLPVLMLSMHAEEQYAVRALRAGAAGYVTKKTGAEDLVAAVKKVLAGGRYVSPTLAERLASQIGPDPAPALHELLSDREFQVFRLLASGKTVKAAARELNLSTPSVSNYRARVLAKMGMAKNSDLVQYAIVHRIFE